MENVSETRPKEEKPDNLLLVDEFSLPDQLQTTSVDHFLLVALTLSYVNWIWLEMVSLSSPIFSAGMQRILVGLPFSFNKISSLFSMLSRFRFSSLNFSITHALCTLIFCYFQFRIHKRSSLSLHKIKTKLKTGEIHYFQRFTKYISRYTPNTDLLSHNK